MKKSKKIPIFNSKLIKEFNLEPKYEVEQSI